MWTKFGLLIDFGLLKAATSTTNTKPEVVLSGRGWHLEKVDMTLFFHNVWSDIGLIQIKTGSRIPIWRTEETEEFIS